MSEYQKLQDEFDQKEKEIMVEQAIRDQRIRDEEEKNDK